MEIAVLSDIHGNYIALEKCMNYALKRNIDTFLFLGDYVGELPYPERAMKMLYEIKEKYHCTFIRGNKEDYWIYDICTVPYSPSSFLSILIGVC